MEFESLALDGLFLIKPNLHKDARGFFVEQFRADQFLERGLVASYLQDNASFSNYGVLRGLHFQVGEHAQTKLVRVAVGEILDVAVDLRRASPTFGHYVAVRLSAENMHALYIPKGFAHGFSVLSKNAFVQYKCDNLWHLQSERGLLFSDPALGIDWQIDDKELIVSEKDRCFPLLKDLVFEELL